MPPLSRRLRAAAFILYGLAAAGTAALAQETSNTIGPPQLKDFTLPGQRTTPPVTIRPAPPTSPPATTPPPRSAPVMAPTAGRDRPAPRSAAPAARRDTPPAESAPASSPSGARPAPQVAPPSAVTAPEPLAQPPAAVPAPAAPEPQSASWLWPALGGALVLLLAGLLLLRRRRGEAALAQARDAARGELGGGLFAEQEPEPEPAPEPMPAPEPEAPAAPRPWLELDIVPERAAATDAEAVVHYALTVTNQGDSSALNIRIDPRLFNAGAEGDMAAFFQGPIHDRSGSPQITIAPGGTLKLNGQVAMPMAEVREIEMAGRRIFVPMVAINVAYDWAGGGTGRTSRSWLVGREAETPQAKMGPFRLDLGPRIYRSVGRREARLVRV
jgi:hypothetical protein